MEIYLIRHTEPLIDKDVCYGQTDVPIDKTIFEQTTNDMLSLLPEKADALYSSSLMRCSHLAQYLQTKYKDLVADHNSLLKELDFGDWENKKWDDINQIDLQKWMNDFVNETVPGGESFIDLHHRTKLFLCLLNKSNYTSVIVVTHAGVIRSVCSHIQQTLLKDAFSITCNYGSVTRFKLSKKFRQSLLTIPPGQAPL